MLLFLSGITRRPAYRLGALILAVLNLASLGWSRRSTDTIAGWTAEKRAESVGGRPAPVFFELNRGQFDPLVRFAVRRSGHDVFLLDRDMLIVSRREQAAGTPKPAHLRVEFLGAGSEPKAAGEDLAPGVANYLIGKAPPNWLTGIPLYGKVRVAEIYPGIDLLYYGGDRGIECDFIVRPGGDARRIEMAFRGARKVRVDGRGDLRVQSAMGEILWRKPSVYTERAGVRHPLDVTYVVRGNRVKFSVPEYLRAETLVIDPSFVFSTYLGGSSQDSGTAIAVDPLGNIVVAGTTSSTDFPSAIPLQGKKAGGTYLFVTKLSSSGQTLLYSTCIGGSGTDVLGDMALDASGNIYLTGSTQSGDFPIAGAIQSSLKGSGPNAFVLKLNPRGDGFEYSTYLGGGGADHGLGIAIGSDKSTYIAGATSSLDFPTLNAFQPARKGDTDAFVAKINASGSALVYSTYLGGGQAATVSTVKSNFGRDIAVDSQGAAYVVGETWTKDFPVLNAYQSDFGFGMTHGFLTKLQPDGSKLVFSTYVGVSAWDACYAIALDNLGNIYTTGSSADSATYTSGGGIFYIGPAPGLSLSSQFPWVAKFSPAGSQRVYMATIGSHTGGGMGSAIAVDARGAAFVAGSTYAESFPTVQPLQANRSGIAFQRDAFVSVVNPDGAALEFSTYLGGGAVDAATGIAVDSSGTVYVAGNTTSADFPVFQALQTSMGASPQDAWVAKISPEAGAGACTMTCSAGVPATARNSDTVTFNSAVAISQTNAGKTQVDWTFGDGSPVTVGRQVTHQYSTYGTYAWTMSTTGPCASQCSRTGSITITGSPSFSASSVSNAASYSVGGVAPGELVTIFGLGIGPPQLNYLQVTPDGLGLTKTLANTTVTFDGVPAALIYASGTQTTAVTPYSVAGKASTTVAVTYNGVQGSASLPVVAAAPGIFSSNASGTGPGAIVNQNSTVNSRDNPAELQSVVALFATGGGETVPASVDGALTLGEPPRQKLPVSVSIGGIPAEVLYSGSAPNMVAGMMQVNARIPKQLAGLAATRGVTESVGATSLSRHPAVYFEPNLGQFDSSVRAAIRGLGYGFFATSQDAVFWLRGGSTAEVAEAPAGHPAETLPRSVVRMRFDGADPGGIEFLDELPGRSNYFIGDDPAAWRTAIPHFAGVRLANVYPGIDVVHRSVEGTLEFDFIVHAGADPKRIELAFDGADALRVDSEGNLVFTTPAGELTLRRPAAFQEDKGVRQPAPISYRVGAGGRVRLETPNYDANRALVIDPQVVFTSYLGGTQSETNSGVVLDKQGNLYMLGTTTSTDFPVVKAVQPAFGGSSYSNQAYITKLDPTGATLIYSTYFGGFLGLSANGIAVDNSGSVCFVGSVFGPIPTVKPVQPNSGGGSSDAYVAKLDATGSRLVYATYLGGADGDYGNAVAMDDTGACYVVGSTASANFPVVSALQARSAGSTDAFVAKLNPDGSALVFSTYLGGASYDTANGVAVDGAGNVYLTGQTSSGNFPLQNPLQNQRHGYYDAFFAKINPSGTALVYSTYFGGSDTDSGASVVVGADGALFATGTTQSPDFPTVNASQPQLAGGTDAFVVKLNPAGSSVEYSTYLGGSQDETGAALALDSAGMVAVTGTTHSTNFPVLNAYQGTLQGPSDAFLVRLDPVLGTRLFSTYHGGTGADYGGGLAAGGNNNLYLSGYGSTPVGMAAGPTARSYAGGYEAWVVKVNPVSTQAVNEVEILLKVGQAASNPVSVAVRTGQSQ